MRRPARLATTRSSSFGEEGRRGKWTPLHCPVQSPRLISLAQLKEAPMGQNSKSLLIKAYHPVEEASQHSDSPQMRVLLPRAQARQISRRMRNHCTLRECCLLCSNSALCINQTSKVVTRRKRNTCHRETREPRGYDSRQPLLWTALQIPSVALPLTLMVMLRRPRRLLPIRLVKGSRCQLRCSVPR